MPETTTGPSQHSRPLGSGTQRLRKKGGHKDRLGLKSLWLILAILVIFGVGFVLSGGGVEFLRNLYSPVAIIVVIFAMIEYIVLKGRDRSRIYYLELEQLRQRRHEEIEFLRNLEEELGRLGQTLESLSATVPGGADGLSASVEELRQTTKRIADVRQNIARRF